MNVVDNLPLQFLKDLVKLLYYYLLSAYSGDRVTR